MKSSLAIPRLASLAIRNDAEFTSPSRFNPILEADRSMRGMLPASQTPPIAAMPRWFKSSALSRRLRPSSGVREAVGH
jgi:hypothetical protein